MAALSTTVALAGTPELLVTGTGGSATVPKRVVIQADAAITIGGEDAQTFPVLADTPLHLDLVAGDDIYGDGTATVEVLELNV